MRSNQPTDSARSDVVQVGASSGSSLAKPGMCSAARSHLSRCAPRIVEADTTTASRHLLVEAPAAMAAPQTTETTMNQRSRGTASPCSTTGTTKARYATWAARSPAIGSASAEAGPAQRQAMSDPWCTVSGMAQSTRQNGGRWSNWVGRARLCFQAAGAIDATTTTLAETARELESAEDTAALEAAQALRVAEEALRRAREAVRTALQARQMTPANREPAYGLQ